MPSPEDDPGGKMADECAAMQQQHSYIGIDIKQAASVAAGMLDSGYDEIKEEEQAAPQSPRSHATLQPTPARYPVSAHERKDWDHPPFAAPTPQATPQSDEAQSSPDSDATPGDRLPIKGRGAWHAADRDEPRGSPEAAETPAVVNAAGYANPASGNDSATHSTERLPIKVRGAWGPPTPQ